MRDKPEYAKLLRAVQKVRWVAANERDREYTAVARELVPRLARTIEVLAGGLQTVVNVGDSFPTPATAVQALEAAAEILDGL